MTVQQRREEILKLLQQRERMQVDTLSELLGVSKVTIRGDLERLEQRGSLMRTHGGATLCEKVGFHYHIEHAMQEQCEEKKAIASLAASLVSDGQTLLIDSGSTTLEMASFLSGKHLGVATNSLPLLQRLCKEEGLAVTVIGGSLYSPSMSTLGDGASSRLSGMHASWLFLGCSGYSVEKGVSTANLREAETKKEMLQIADKVCVLADHTKKGKNDFAHVADWSWIDVMVTDWIDTETRIILEGYGVRVMVAPKENGGTKPCCHVARAE